MAGALSTGEAIELLYSFATSLLDTRNCTGAKKPASGGDATASDGEGEPDYDPSSLDFENAEMEDEYANDDGVVSDDADGDGVDDNQLEEHEGDFEPPPNGTDRKQYNLLKTQVDLCYRGHDFQMLVTYVAPAAVTSLT